MTNIWFILFQDEGNVLRNLTVIENESHEEMPKDQCSFTLSCRPDRERFKSNVNISHLKPSTAHGLLKHAVIVLLAHIGFDKASDYAIATLTDVADHFLRRMGLLIKVASEENNCGFPVNGLKIFQITFVYCTKFYL